MTRQSRRFGRYELLTEIGRGGMADLYLGRLLGLAGFAKPVAIKRMLPHLTEDVRFVQMFLNEGRIAAHLSHPNVCQVIELGEVDGELFLAMEYLEGVPWGELVAGRPRDPIAIVRLAASVIGQACDGLHYAHMLTDGVGQPTPVVHRDVSPGNLFVTVDGICKVLDFGVSKMLSEGETRSGLIKGKLPYMPPEQVRGEDVDARVDVFATGVCLWEALTGARLFVRSNEYLIFKAILEEPIPSVADYHREYGAFGGALDAVLARALERDRDRRYPSIRAFADDLRGVAARYGGSLAAAEVAALVRHGFHERLAERSRLVASVSGVQLPPRDSGGARTDDHDDSVTNRVEPATADDGPSVTRSVMLRGGESMAVERKAARRPRLRWLALALGVAAIVAAISILAPRGETREAAVVSLDAALTFAQAVGSPDGLGADAGASDAALGSVSDVVIDALAPDDAMPADEITMVEPAIGSAAPRTQPRPRVTPREPITRTTGSYSVDSNPYATIFIDGKRRDQTPLFRVALAPGRHQIRAVLANGRQRSFTIRIEAGKDVSSGTLSW